jgi:cell division protease FtsH
VKRIVDETFERTVVLLTERRELLERTAKFLLEKETLNETDLASLAHERSLACRWMAYR